MATDEEKLEALIERAEDAPTDPPDRAWWKSRKFLIVTVGSVTLEATAAAAMFMGKAQFVEWSSFSLTLFGLAMGLYGLANVASQFAMARANK